MPEPRFGNCRDCAAWIKPIQYLRPEKHRYCCRRSLFAQRREDDGCFDFLPLPSPPENDNG